MVSASPAKDIVPRVRCTENTNDSTEKRIKTTPKHIRFFSTNVKWDSRAEKGQKIGSI